MRSVRGADNVRVQITREVRFGRARSRHAPSAPFRTLSRRGDPRLAPGDCAMRVAVRCRWHVRPERAGLAVDSVGSGRRRALTQGLVFAGNCMATAYGVPGLSSVAAIDPKARPWGELAGLGQCFDALCASAQGALFAKAGQQVCRWADPSWRPPSALRSRACSPWADCSSRRGGPCRRFSRERTTGRCIGPVPEGGRLSPIQRLMPCRAHPEATMHRIVIAVSASRSSRA